MEATQEVKILDCAINQIYYDKEKGQTFVLLHAEIILHSNRRLRKVKLVKTDSEFEICSIINFGTKRNVLPQMKDKWVNEVLKQLLNYPRIRIKLIFI